MKTQKTLGEKIENLVELFDQGEFHKTIKRASRMTKDYPEIQVLYNLLGAAHSKLKQYDSAVRNFQKATNLNPSCSDTFNSWGILEKSRGRFDDAIKCFNKAIDLSPEHEEARLNLGNTYFELKSYDLATACFQKLLQIKPSSYAAAINMGATYSKQNNLKLAHASYQKALDISPNSVPALNAMGDVLVHQRQLVDAFIYFEKALQLNPDSQKAKKSIGNLLLLQKDYHRAYGMLCDFSDQDSIAKSAECLYFQGKVQEFDNLVNRMVKHDPANVRLAAISALASHELRRKDNYPFFPKALDHIYFSQLSCHVSDTKEFIAEILNEIDRKTSEWEPQGKTTVKGYQTPPELFLDPKPAVIRLKKFLANEIKKFIKDNETHVCWLINKRPSQMNLRGWFVRLLRGGYQEAHIHPGGWLSGVVYLKTNPKQSEDEGAIEFGLHGYNFALKDMHYPWKIYRPKEGDIVIFPSNVFHKTVKIEAFDERCVIAFDLTP